MLNWIYWLFRKIPPKITIERVEDYHTHYLGKCSQNRLFWGYETFYHTKEFGEIGEQDWKLFCKKFAVLHLFESNGKYVETKYWEAGLTYHLVGNIVEEKLEHLIKQIEPIKFCNIKVELFTTKIDDVQFGLVPNKEDLTVDLQPSSTISFTPPWNGTYYT